MSWLSQIVTIIIWAQIVNMIILSAHLGSVRLSSHLGSVRLLSHLGSVRLSAHLGSARLSSRLGSVRLSIYFGPVTLSINKSLRKSFDCAHILLKISRLHCALISLKISIGLLCVPHCAQFGEKHYMQDVHTTHAVGNQQSGPVDFVSRRRTPVAESTTSRSSRQSISLPSRFCFCFFSLSLVALAVAC